MAEATVGVMHGAGDTPEASPQYLNDPRSTWKTRLPISAVGTWNWQTAVVAVWLQPTNGAYPLELHEPEMIGGAQVWPENCTVTLAVFGGVTQPSSTKPSQSSSMALPQISVALGWIDELLSLQSPPEYDAFAGLAQADTWVEPYPSPS